MSAIPDTPPPGQEKARPLARVEQCEFATPTHDAQAPAPESALMALCKAYMRAGITDRRLFLRDVRVGAPNLWREVEREYERKAVRP